MKYLLNGEIANWKVLPDFYLSNLVENFLIFYSNLDHLKNVENSKKLNIPEFYKEIIEIRLQVNVNNLSSPKQYDQIRKQIIWCNKNIKFKDKCLIFDDWIHSG